MGLRERWEDHVLPRLTHRALQGEPASTWRREVCAGASGTVVEVGFGSGPNLEHFPPTVTTILAVEPADLAWQLASDRVEDFGRPVERVATDAADLPLEDESADTVVSTWSLCTVPEVTAALHEARRVLRPGGTLRFVEHGLHPDPVVARRQRRMQRWWGPVAGGCHVDRDLPLLMRDAGFVVDVTRAEDVAPGLARAWGWFVTGTARPA